MKLSSRDRRAIILGGGGLVAVLIVRFALMPWVDSWSDARARIDADSVRLEGLKTKMDRLLRMRKRVTEMYGPAAKGAIEDIEAARIRFRKTVTDVLKANGVQFERLDPRPAKDVPGVPGLQLVPLQVKGKCPLASLAKCLSALREAKTLVIVEQVSATGDPKKPGTLDVTLLLQTLAKGKRSAR